MTDYGLGADLNAIKSMKNAPNEVGSWLRTLWAGVKKFGLVFITNKVAYPDASTQRVVMGSGILTGILAVDATLPFIRPEATFTDAWIEARGGRTIVEWIHPPPNETEEEVEEEPVVEEKKEIEPPPSEDNTSQPVMIEEIEQLDNSGAHPPWESTEENRDDDLNLQGWF